MVFNVRESGNILKAVQGDLTIGTIVTVNGKTQTAG